MKKKAEMAVEVLDLDEVAGLIQKLRSESKQNTELLTQILTRLDVIVNILLDLIPDERFIKPRKLTHKVGRLDATGVELRPIEIGKMLGRPSKDIASRRKEFRAQAAKRLAASESNPRPE